MPRPIEPSLSWDNAPDILTPKHLGQLLGVSTKKANEIYEQLINEVKRTGIQTEKGIFGADMKVDLLNDGPVTIFIDSKNRE